MKMSFEKDIEKRLLIVGAGDHSQVVREISESLGFNEFYYLDDKKQDECVIGCISDLAKYKDRFKYSFISIGHNQLRKVLFNKAVSLGYQIPKLISPHAYVSSSADIGKGCLICPMACIQANTVIEDGCFVSSGATLDHNVKVGCFAHINAGVVCKSGIIINELTKVDTNSVS